MSHWPEEERRDQGQPSRRGPDDEPTEIVGDEFAYFYEPRDASSRRGDTRQYSPEDARVGRAVQGQGRAQQPPQSQDRNRQKRQKRSRGRKALTALAVVLILLIGFLVYVDLKLTKVDALADYEGRPPATPGQDWLLVGSDSRQGLTPQQREELSTGKASGGRTDTIMLLHISRFGGRATLVSLPRDTLVDIPSHVTEDGEQHGGRQGKLNAAYASGGPRLLSRTVEQETGIRLDKYMEIGLGGFVNAVKAVGGVRMCLDKPMRDKKAGINLSAGCQTLNGSQALGYVRARYSVEKGDLGRVQHQRKFLRALFDEVSRPATFLNPIAMTKLTNAGTGALVVDNGTGPLALLWLAFQMRQLTGEGGGAITVPVAGTKSEPGVGSVVVWDREQAVKLFEALQQDEPVPSSVTSEGSGN